MSDGARYYIGPFLLALTVHLLAAAALYANWNPSQNERLVIEPPRAVQSTLLVLEPEPVRARPKPQPKPSPAPQLSEPAEPQPQEQPRPEPVAEPAEPQPDPAAERRRAEEQARQEAEERARQERLQALSQTSFEEALEDEAEALAQVEGAEDEAAAMSFRNGIYQAVVANWSRPPSARNGMEAKLLVELVPTGDVVQVTVLESSGNAAFDRSAESAVRRARRFEVPTDPDVFEEYFRRFTLLFRPEDLLR